MSKIYECNKHESRVNALDSSVKAFQVVSQVLPFDRPNDNDNDDQKFGGLTRARCSHIMRYQAILKSPALPDVNIIVKVTQLLDRSKAESSVLPVTPSSIRGLDNVRVFSAGMLAATALAAMWEQKILTAHQLEPTVLEPTVLEPTVLEPEQPYLPCSRRTFSAPPGL
jgi:hypothetical protein